MEESKVKAMQPQPQPQPQPPVEEYVEEFEEVTDQPAEQPTTPTINEDEIQKWQSLEQYINSTNREAVGLSMDIQELETKTVEVKAAQSKVLDKLKEAYRFKQEFIKQFSYKYDIVEGLVVGFNQTGEPLVDKAKMDEINKQK